MSRTCPNCLSDQIILVINQPERKIVNSSSLVTSTSFATIGATISRSIPLPVPPLVSGIAGAVVGGLLGAVFGSDSQPEVQPQRTSAYFQCQSCAQIFTD